MPEKPNAMTLELVAFFVRNGYVRRHNPVRYAAVGCMKYKKGDEIRLVANDAAERTRILRLLKSAGFHAGCPFRKDRKSRQYRVPVYGRGQVARFLEIVEQTGVCRPVPARRGAKRATCAEKASRQR